MPRKISQSLSKTLANMKEEGKTTTEIQKWLKERGYDVTLQTVRYHAFKRTLIRMRTPAKCTWRVKMIMDDLRREDDKLTAGQIRRIFHSECNLDVSCSSIKRMKRQMGWSYIPTRKKAIKKDINKEKRVRQATEWIESGEQFNDVLFSDVTSVALDDVHRMSLRKRANAAVRKRPKHKVQVLAWGCISRLGGGPFIVFEGVMDRTFYQDHIITESLVPFVRKYYPSGHRLFQDNNPTYSASAAFLEENGINWQRTPPESPDMNPMHLVWAQLKKFIRSEIKPKNKKELLGGIMKFWKDVLDPQQCNEYIGQLQRVLPVIVERKGQATGIVT